MKYLKQFGVLAAVTCAGEILKFFIPLPIPGSIYGLLLLLVLLMSGIIRLEQVEGAADFLLEIMPVLFIPAAAGLLTAWSALSEILVPVGVITVISTVAVITVTGKTAEGMLRRTGSAERKDGFSGSRKKEGKEDSGDDE